MKNLKKFKLFEQELLEKEGLRKDAIHVKFKKDGKEYPGMVYGVNNDKKTASIYSDSFDKELEIPLKDVIDGLKEDHIPYNQAVLDVYIKFREQGKNHGEATEAAAHELKLTYEDVEGEVNKASDDETWIDPAGGEHSGDEEDPAKMYEIDNPSSYYWPDGLKKLYTRQIASINKFGFLTLEELQKFCWLAYRKYNNRDSSWIDGYFQNSRGFRTEEEQKAVSKKLADYIKGKIVAKESISESVNEGEDPKNIWNKMSDAEKRGILKNKLNIDSQEAIEYVTKRFDQLSPTMAGNVVKALMNKEDLEITEAETHTYKVPNNAVKVPKGDTGFDLVKKHYRRFIWTWNQYADKKPNITND